MKWSAVDALNQVARIDHDGAILFAGLSGSHAPTPVYAPVVMSDGVEAILAYREPLPDGGPRDEPVWVVASDGHARVLPFTCEGKWPLAARCTGRRQFEVAAIGAGTGIVHIASITMADLGLTINGVETISIPRALVFLEYADDGWMHFANGDGIVDAKAFTRAGSTQLLTYWREVGGRVIGADADPNAPNRILLGESDGWYLVADHPLSTAFPAYLSNDGTATVFEGQVYTLAEIRRRPFDVPDLPPVDGYNPKPELLVVLAGIREAKGKAAEVVMELDIQERQLVSVIAKLP